MQLKIIGIQLCEGNMKVKKKMDLEKTNAERGRLKFKQVYQKHWIVWKACPCYNTSQSLQHHSHPSWAPFMSQATLHTQRSVQISMRWVDAAVWETYFQVPSQRNASYSTPFFITAKLGELSRKWLVTSTLLREIKWRSIHSSINRFLGFPMVYEVWQKSNDTDFYLQKFLFLSNVNVIPFKIVPLGSYTLMEMFPLLVAALEVFNRYGLQHVRYSLLDIL